MHSAVRVLAGVGKKHIFRVAGDQIARVVGRSRKVVHGILSRTRKW